MRKIKKSLAVLLTVLMLASFTSLFASAATTTLNYKNCIILEAPKITYGDQIEVNKITVNYGVSPKDLTVTGGKLAYIASEGSTPIEIPGTFSGASTSKLAVGDATAIRLKFTPEDTTTYSSPTVSNTFSMADGIVWPTAKVIGQTAILDTLPTPSSTTVGLGARLSTITFSGGKVVDETGTEITGGRWRFVNNNSNMETEGTFEEEYQWTKTGYEPIKLKLTVTVKMFKTTLAEAPTMTDIAISDRLQPTYRSSSVSGGKVVDEDGNEVTGGTWTVTYPDETYAFCDTTVSLTWKKTGYESITTTAVIHVLQNHSTYTFEKGAKLAISNRNLTYSPDQTWANTEIIPGIIKDKSGNIVEGTYAIRNSGNSTTNLTGAIGASSSSFTLAYIFFIPNDTTLPEYYFIDKIGTVAKADFALSEDSELVLNYGEAIKTPYQDYYGDFRFSTLKTVPEEAGVYSIGWSVDIFDPATADYGSVNMVEVSVSPNNKSYNTMKLTIPVRIQNFVHDENNSWYGMSTNLDLSGSIEESYDGIKNYKINVTNKRLKGTIDLIINEEVVASVAPDENGKFYAEGQWIAPASGEYTYRFEYKPSDEDTATVTNPATFDKTFTIELRPYHTLTVNVGDDVYTFTERVGKSVHFDWKDKTGLTIEDFGSWKFTDANGNAYTPKYAGGTSNSETVDITTQPSIYIVMPDHDVVATAKNASILGSFGDDSGLDSLLSFFERLKNWLIELYRTIVEYLIPTVEEF